MLWGCVDFALMAESRRVVEHVRLHPVGGCSAQRLTNQPTVPVTTQQLTGISEAIITSDSVSSDIFHLFFLTI